MSVSELFLKKNNAGKRRPTFLLLIVVPVVVFCMYFLPNNKKPLRGKVKGTIIKEKDIVEAANNTLKEKGKKFELDYSQALTPNQASQNATTGNPLGFNFKPKSTVSSKMIVFDNTKDYESSQLVPLGSMVKCLLIHNIVTNNFDAPVIAQIWEDFYFNGKLLLPFGTRIYGVAFAGKQRDRVMVKFDNIVFQDGKTIQINAIGLSNDGSGGITGTVIDEHNKKTFIEMALNFLSGMALGLQQTATNQVTGINEIETNSRNAILHGAASAFQSEAQRIKGDTESAKGYAIVLAGSDLIAYFEKAADVQIL